MAQVRDGAAGPRPSMTRHGVVERPREPIARRRDKASASLLRCARAEEMVLAPQIPPSIRLTGPELNLVDPLPAQAGDRSLTEPCATGLRLPDIREMLNFV